MTKRIFKNHYPVYKFVAISSREHQYVDKMIIWSTKSSTSEVLLYWTNIVTLLN